MRHGFIFLSIVAVILALMLTPNDQNKIQELERRIASLESAKNNSISNQLKTPLDFQSKEIIRSVLDEQLAGFSLDTSWNNFFYYMSFFEGADGWAGGGATIGIEEAALTTGASSGDSASVLKSPVYQNILTFDKQSRFRSAMTVDESTSIEFYAGVGDGGKGVSASKHYGFYIENATLYGTVSNGTTQSTVTLLTGLTATYTYFVEARFVPGQKVVFYVAAPSDARAIERGTISTNIPSGSFGMDSGGLVVNPFLLFEVITRTTAARHAHASFVEYIQLRKEF